MYQAKPDAQVYQVQGSNIYQGYLEGSNIDMVVELADMIVTQRLSSSTKGLQAADEMWQMANNLRTDKDVIA